MAKRRLRRRSAEPSQYRRRWTRVGSHRKLVVFGSIGVAVALLAAMIVVDGPAATSSTARADEPVSVEAGPSSSEPPAASDSPLLGEAVLVAAGSIHAVDPTDLIPSGLPSAGGPHAAAPLPTGVFNDPIAVEGSAVHSLEHSAVWIADSPSLLSESAVARLERVVRDFPVDVILAPRPQNVVAIALVSWGRRLVAQDVDEALVADFVRTNRNRSPEPGVR